MIHAPQPAQHTHKTAPLPLHVSANGLCHHPLLHNATIVVWYSVGLLLLLMCIVTITITNHHNKWANTITIRIHTHQHNDIHLPYWVTNTTTTTHETVSPRSNMRGYQSPTLLCIITTLVHITTPATTTHHDVRTYTLMFVLHPHVHMHVNRNRGADHTMLSNLFVCGSNSHLTTMWTPMDLPLNNNKPLNTLGKHTKLSYYKSFDPFWKLYTTLMCFQGFKHLYMCLAAS